AEVDDLTGIEVRSGDGVGGEQVLHDYRRLARTVGPQRRDDHARAGDVDEHVGEHGGPVVRLGLDGAHVRQHGKARTTAHAEAVATQADATVDAIRVDNRPGLVRRDDVDELRVHPRA